MSIWSVHIRRNSAPSLSSQPWRCQLLQAKYKPRSSRHQVDVNWSNWIESSFESRFWAFVTIGYSHCWNPAKVVSGGNAFGTRPSLSAGGITNSCLEATECQARDMPRLSLPAAEAHPQRNNKLQIGRQCWRLESLEWLEVNLRVALRKGPACSAALPGSLARWTGNLPFTSIYFNYLQLSSGRAWSSAASTSARLKHLQPSCSSRVKGSMSFPSCNTTDQGKSTPQMVVLYNTQITRTSSPQPLENLVDMQIASQLCNAESKSIERMSKAKSFKL